jgi:DnaJ domain
MMRAALALSVAIDLLRTPSRVWVLRSAPLPQGVDLLLQIAAGDAEAESHAVEITGRSAETVHSAATFFIEQILFYSEADSYRSLGVNPQASSSELRHNMALLLKWLHPDKEGDGIRSLYATNVTKAWNDLKTDERRALYDSTRPVTTRLRRSRSRDADVAHRKNLARPVDSGIWARFLTSRLRVFLFGRLGL